ncbi:hypothetical protein H8959_006576, partial [Pygathrix nigripes]
RTPRQDCISRGNSASKSRAGGTLRASPATTPVLWRVLLLGKLVRPELYSSPKEEPREGPFLQISEPWL